jgi:hypothetical protein
MDWAGGLGGGGGFNALIKEGVGGFAGGFWVGGFCAGGFCVAGGFWAGGFWVAGGFCAGGVTGGADVVVWAPAEMDIKIANKLVAITKDALRMAWIVCAIARDRAVDFGTALTSMGIRLAATIDRRVLPPSTRVISHRSPAV